MPRITDFCSCIYVLGCKLSLVRLCDSDFGITGVDDITIGIACAAFCLHIAHISFASSWYLFYYYYYYYYYYYRLLSQTFLPGTSIEPAVIPTAQTSSWLTHCTTSRKVAGSIPGGVTGIFHVHSPSCRTMALGLTQPLTQMSTRNISWG